MSAANLHFKFKLQFTFSLQIAKTCTISCPSLPAESRCFLRGIFCINITLWQVYITAGFFPLCCFRHWSEYKTATVVSIKDIRNCLMLLQVPLTLRKFWKVHAGPSSKPAKYSADEWAEHNPQSPQLIPFGVQQVRGSLWCKNCKKEQVKNKKQ